MPGCSAHDERLFTVCPHCGDLVVPSLQASAFEIFGEEPSYFVDLEKIQKRFYEISRTLHPDRFQNSSDDLLFKATDWFARLNGALAVLKDDDDRAQALFTLAAFAPTGSKSALPPEFAEDYFTLQESLEDSTLSPTERRRQFIGFKILIETKLQECDRKRDTSFREWQNSGNPLGSSARPFFEKAALAINQKAYLTSMLRDLETKCQTS